MSELPEFKADPLYWRDRVITAGREIAADIGHARRIRHERIAAIMHSLARLREGEERRGVGLDGRGNFVWEAR